MSSNLNPNQLLPPIGSVDQRQQEVSAEPDEVQRQHVIMSKRHFMNQVFPIYTSKVNHWHPVLNPALPIFIQPMICRRANDYNLMYHAIKANDILRP